MELNSKCLRCKNFKYHVFSQKVKVTKCDVGLNCKQFVVSCSGFVPKYIGDTIPDNEKKYQCNLCKYSSLEFLDPLGFVYKCNNIDCLKANLNNTNSIYKCKFFELDSNKLPVSKSLFD